MKYVVHQNYFVDGKVTLLLQVDERENIEFTPWSLPNLKNKQAFIDDMNYLLKRFKKKWTPAQLNGQPVKSFVLYRINFSTMSYDEE